MLNYSLSKIKSVWIILMAAGIIFIGFFGTRIDLNLIKTEAQKAIEEVGNKISVFGQEVAPHIYPRYPQRLIYLVSATAFESETLSSLNEELNQLIETCNCRFAQSQCSGGGAFCSPGPVKVFGDPCANVRKAIEDKQLNIKEKTEQLLYFKNLLEKEMETGLEKELQILMPEALEELKTNIENLTGESQTMISLTENNSSLPYDCLTKNCSASCQLGSVFSLKACLMIGTGEQKSINLKFKAGVSLEDLELGEIGIKNINLGLPKELQIPKVGDLSLTLPSQEVVLTFPEMTMAELQSKKLIDLSSQPININNQFSLPEIPSLNLSCPNLPSRSSYQCSSSNEEGEVESIEYRWYFQTFSFLSEKCQGLSSMKGSYWLEEKAKDCFDPEKLPQVIPPECEPLWDDHCDSENPGPEPSEICKKIRADCRDANGKVAAALQCQNLFNQEKKTVPSACTYEIDSEDRYIFPPDFNPVETLKNKCNELKTEKRKDPPEPCEILPLFTGKIDSPKDWEHITGGGECPSQEIANFPSSMLGCPASPPTLPKISLPKIVIPDIIMPYFRIPPFLEVKLPSFYFEDLVLPDINLCDLNDCANIFPSLNFKFPFLNLPSLSSSLKLPDLDLLFQGIPIKVPFPEIKTNFKLPSIPFYLPRLSLSNILTPRLEMPQFSLPKPKITFGFSGIDLSAIFELIITFILNALDVPDYGMCINFSATAIPIRIIFPDYYFYWPAFPQIPEIPFCKDIQSFCKNVKTSLKDVTDKIGEIEEALNQSVMKDIQQKLDQTSQLLNNGITNRINATLGEYSQLIRTKAQEAINLAKIENGIIKIPPIVVRLPEKKIPIPLADMLGFPEKISIPWPESLKEINLTKPLTYNLPTIPLSKLKYEKEITVKGPGFQPRTISIDLGALGNSGECINKAPSGGNPCPVSRFQNNLNGIQSAKTSLQETSSKIIRIVETAIY